MKLKQLFIAIAAIHLGVLTAFADVRLPAVFSDQMVLQQRSKVTVWGWAEPGEKIKVKGSWQWLGGVSTQADADGAWRVRLKTPRAGGPHTLTVQGTNEIVLNDVLIGEVWVCSGQSNMQWSLEKLNTERAESDTAKADFPQMRLFTVPCSYAAEPKADCTGTWQTCTPESARSFSVVGFYFGRELQQELGVPIGLIHTSWGGSMAEAWTSAEALRDHGGFDEPLDTLQSVIQEKKLPYQHIPSALYNAMIHPLLPYRIAGAIWYQGESNCPRWRQYRTLFPAMAADWRTRWGQGDFPFYYVQIAPFAYEDSDKVGSALLREAQMMALDVIPHSGMAVTMDIGEENNIHPSNKHDVGHRLALWALGKTYGRKKLVCSGPIYTGMKVERDTLRLMFDYAGSGLVSRGGPLIAFEIAGQDRHFVPAKAEIDGDTVVVSSSQVPQPASVRYAFKNWARPNLFNAEGLPASSFRTDDWPVE